MHTQLRLYVCWLAGVKCTCCCMLHDGETEPSAIWRAHLDSLHAEIRMDRDWVVVQPGESDNVFWGADALLQRMKSAPAHIILRLGFHEIVIKFFIEHAGGLSPRVRFCCYAATELKAWVRVVFQVVTEQTPVPKYLEECTLAPVTLWQEDLKPCDLSSFMPNYEARYGPFLMPSHQAGLSINDDTDEDGDNTMWQMNLYVRVKKGEAHPADPRIEDSAC